MQAEVLSVGTELLLGQTVNTDTTIVAKALSALGIDLLYAAVVGDNVGRLEKAVYDALDRSDILITTGGLGPTGDDLTKETVAAAARSIPSDADRFARAELPAFARLLCKRRHDRKPDEAGDAAGGLHRAEKRQRHCARLRVPDGQGQDRHHAARPAFGIDPDAAQLCRAVP